MLAKGLLLGLEISRVPLELPMRSFEAGDMLTECVLFPLDARHTSLLVVEKPALVLEKRQRRLAVERASNLIECAQLVAGAPAARMNTALPPSISILEWFSSPQGPSTTWLANI